MIQIRPYTRGLIGLIAFIVLIYIPAIGLALDAPSLSVTTSGPESVWRVYDDFNDNSFNSNLWYPANGKLPTEAGGQLYLDYAGDDNIWIGTNSGINGVQAELKLSSASAQNDNSDLQVGLNVLAEGTFRYSICFELSSSDNPGQAQIEVAIYDNDNDDDTDDKVFDYHIPAAQYDKYYTLGIIINGDVARFFVDNAHVMDVDISSFNIDHSVDLFPFVGCWSKYNYDTATGYVDNVKVTGSAYNVIDFDSDSAAITNTFWPLKMGREFALYKNSDGTLRKRGLISEQLVKGGVNCLKLDLWDDDGFQGCLYIAQDKTGNIRTIGHDMVGEPEWIHPNSAGTFITHNPAVGEQYYTISTFLNDEKRTVVAVNETVTTSQGTFTGCVKIKLTGWGHPEWVDYAWYCPDYGWIKWEENDTSSGWQEISEFAPICHAADNATNFKTICDWLEINLPDYFSPKAETFETSGFLIRYYQNTDTYVGTINGEFYVLGGVFGNEVVSVGTNEYLLNLINPSDAINCF